MPENIGFETAFHSSEYDWTFQAVKTLREVIQHIEAYYPQVAFSYSAEGFKVLSEGRHIGNLTPTQPNRANAERLQRLLLY